MYYIHHFEKVVLLISYIDDSFITKDNIERVSWFKKELTTKFDMTSLVSVPSTSEFNFHIRMMACCFIKPIRHLTF